MKYLKRFENINESPKIGDYVITNVNLENYVKNYLDNKIGIISDILNKEPKYTIIYEEEFPEYFYKVTIEPNMIALYTDELISWSKDKKKLEIELSAKKYNL